MYSKMSISANVCISRERRTTTKTLHVSHLLKCISIKMLFIHMYKFKFVGECASYLLTSIAITAPHLLFSSTTQNVPVVLVVGVGAVGIVVDLTVSHLFVSFFL